MAGRVLAEATFDRLCSLTDLLFEVRQMARRCRGLAQLHVCNQTRGWSFEQPLMLYAGTFGPRIDADTGQLWGAPPRRAPFHWEL